MHTNGNGNGVNTDRFFTSSPNGSGWSSSDQTGSYQSGSRNMNTSSQHWNTEASSAPIDTKDLSIIQDEMHSEALLYKKCSVYADYFTDPGLKNVARTAAEHHKHHFDQLNGYLNSSR